MVEVLVTHVTGKGEELQQVGEGDVGTTMVARGSIRERPTANEEPPERGAAEDVHGERHSPVGSAGFVEDGEVLHALGREEARPLRELALARERRKRGADDVVPAERALVVSQDMTDGGGGARVVVVGGEEVGVAEDKRGGAPEAAPAGSEGGGARRVRDGEAGHDVAEEVIREGADAVDAIGWSGQRRSRHSGEGGGGAVVAAEPAQDLLDGGGHGGGDLIWGARAGSGGSEPCSVSSEQSWKPS